MSFPVPNPTPLPWNAALLRPCPPLEIRRLILERRLAVRWHRDQEGHERCFLDDDRLFAFLDDTVPRILPSSRDKRMELCAEYYEACSTYEPPESVEPAGTVFVYDADLDQRSAGQLLGVFITIQSAIVRLRNITDRPRTPSDYARLYEQTLPEKIAANFKLPPQDEFLYGTGHLEEGCEPFWESHDDCIKQSCDLSQWGQLCPKKSK